MKISNSPSPEKLEAYKSEYARGAKIFKESLDEYSKCDNFPEKKEQLKKVLEESLDAMNKLANYALRDPKMEQKLSADYRNLADNDTKESIDALNRDLSKIQKHIGGI